MVSSTRAAVAALVASVLLAGCGAVIMPQIHNDADRVTVARRLLDKGDHAMAVEVLSNYVNTGTGNADIDQALYVLGLSYMGEHEYASAQAQFERLTRDFPESDSAVAGAYRLGQAFFGQSRGPDFDQEFTLRAMNQWEAVVQADEAGPWGDLARTRIAECRARLARKLWRTGDVYVKLKLYEPAKVYFGSVIEDYADTPIYGDALIGNAVADARLGRRDSALAVLGRLAKDFEGRPLGLRASAMLEKVKHWPAEGDTRRRMHRSVESTAPTPTPSAPTTTTPYGS